MGDFEPCVRLQCGTVLRMLVPLAPLAKEHSRKYALPVIKEEGRDRSSADRIDGAASYGRGAVRFKMSHKEKMAKLIENILSRQSLPRITESRDPLDAHLMRELSIRSLLLPAPIPAPIPVFLPVPIPIPPSAPIPIPVPTPVSASVLPSVELPLITSTSGGPDKGAHDRPDVSLGTGPSPRLDPSRVFVRPYQWDGVSWLLQLYRCGLGGILAGGEWSDMLQIL